MQEWGTAVLTPLIMKLEHFLPLPDGDKEWLNGLILRLDEFPAHSDIITGRRDIRRGLRRDRRTCVSLQDFEQWRPADLGFYVPRRQNGASQLAAQGN